MLHPAVAPDGSEDRIQNGDLVVVYERFDSLKAVKVNSRIEFSNRFGHFKMQAWVGRPFGTRVFAKAPSTGWVYLLKPTPELWTKALQHRTQILYAADISLICSFLELSPGATVLECGTGSGSLTHALARAVAPHGRVHSFEFHAQRAALAEQEFKEHGMGGVVTVAQRDIEQDGFPESLNGQADAVFLDIPGPWKAVPSAARCLRPNAGLATFSPCIEQVQRTRGALAVAGFWDVHVFECLLREHEVRSERIVADLDATNAVLSGSMRKRKLGAEQPPAADEQPALRVMNSTVVSRPMPEGRGHTGYLVFARCAVNTDLGSASHESHLSTMQYADDALLADAQLSASQMDSNQAEL